MPFDPDQYLLEKDKKEGFDPDSYLSGITEIKKPPESRMPKPVEGAGGAAFGVYRPAGRRPESQQDREASKEMPLQTARGLVTGALGGPSDILNIPGQVYGAVTSQPSPYQVPLGSEEWNKIIPGQPTSPQGELARMGGQLLSPSIIGPSIEAGKKVVSGVKQIVPITRNVMDVGQGMYGTLTNKTALPGQVPKPWQQASQRIPASDIYYTPEDLQLWREGKISTNQLQQSAQPIQNLGPEAITALSKTGGTIPVQGQGFRAYGEQLGETYRNPMNILTDVGLDLATGTPLPTMARLGYKGYKAYQQAGAANTLAKQGFTPQTLEEMAAIASGMPHPNYPTGPIDPARFSQQMAASKIQPVNPATPTPPAQPVSQPVIQPVIQPTTPVKPVAQPPVENVTASTPTVQPVQSTVTKTPSLEQQLGEKGSDILAQIRARKTSEKPTTVEGPVKPDENFKPTKEQKQMEKESRQSSNEEIISRHMSGEPISETTPIDISKDAYNNSNKTKGQAKYLLEKGYDTIPSVPDMTESQVIEAMYAKAKVKDELAKRKKGPGNVSRMMTDDEARTFNTLKMPENASDLEKKIVNMTQENRDKFESILTSALGKDEPMLKKYNDLFNKYRIK